MTGATSQTAERYKPAYGLVAIMALVKLAIHLPLAASYGYFRDELYFLDCGRHLDWGYVDHAPLIGWISKLALMLGASLPLLRSIAAVAGAGVLALTMMMAARLGGEQQILSMHPILLPIWLSGLFFFLLGRGKCYRALGVTYLVLLALFIVMAGKHYYLFPAYPMLFAGGAVAICHWLDAFAWTRKQLWPRIVISVILIAGGCITAPLVLPLLSPENHIAYEKAIGFERHKTEVAHEGPLPQMFGDQFGWEELVADVARIYNALPPDERNKTTIFASNYGEAGALHLYGPRYGLPPAICAHQTHFFWGPQGRKGDVVIWLQWGREHIERYCFSVEQAGEHRHAWGMGEENRAIYVCRGLKTSFEELWPHLKHWN